MDPVKEGNVEGSFSTQTNVGITMLGGAVATIAVWGVETFGAISVPGTVATAIGVVVTGVLCYVLPARRAS